LTIAMNRIAMSPRDSGWQPGFHSWALPKRRTSLSEIDRSNDFFVTALSIAA
jgi:hypothetical protein